MPTLEIHHTELPPLRSDENGTVYVGQTRIPIDTVIWEYWNGASAEQIISDFSTLTLRDVYAVISYYLCHQNEVEAYLEQRRNEALEIRRKVEALRLSDTLRQRLLTRTEKKEQTDAACRLAGLVDKTMSEAVLKIGE